MTRLPQGRPGQALAVALALAVAGLVWLGGIAPSLAWFGDRQDYLAGRLAVLSRMQALAANLPALQQQADRLDQPGAANPPPPASRTDAVAGAALQEAVQDAATRAGMAVSSVEVLPVEPAGRYRRIGLKVAASTSWPVLVKLLESMSAATPPMLVNDVSLQQAPGLAPGENRPLQAGFTVLAFEVGQAPPR